MPHFKLMAVPDRQAGKCMPMPWPALARTMAALLWAALLLGPQPAPAQTSTIVLRDGHGVAWSDSIPSRWFDERGTATLDEVLRNPQRFTPADTGQIQPLAPGKALWLRLRLQ